jgi:DNA-binding transcriptional regulator YiaG
MKPKNPIDSISTPTPAQIRMVREQAGLTQTEAARMVHAGLRAWQHWEMGDRTISLATWELFTLKVGIEKKNE